MSEPIADGVPPLPPLQQLDDRLDVEVAAAQAIDLDRGPGEEPAPAPAAGAPAIAPHGEPMTLTRAQRRAQAEAAEQARSASGALLDHPAVLVVLSVLTLVAVVVGLDLASQGSVVALLPAVLLVGAYVVVVRRRLARR